MSSISPNSPQKQCPTCQEQKPATSDYFFRNKKSRDGFNTPCKSCQQTGRKRPVDIVPEGYKRCTKCHMVKPLEAFKDLPKDIIAKRSANSKQRGKVSHCKECQATSEREHWRRVGHHKKRKYNPQSDRRNQFKRHYGITPEEYQAMFDRQNGFCAVCGKPETTKSRSGETKLLAVDHDHVTGKIRALLCQTCNIGLGNYEKLKPSFALYDAYLLHHMKIAKGD